MVGWYMRVNWPGVLGGPMCFSLRSVVKFRRERRCWAGIGGHCRPLQESCVNLNCSRFGLTPVKPALSAHRSVQNCLDDTQRLRQSDSTTESYPDMNSCIAAVFGS